MVTKTHLYATYPVKKTLKEPLEGVDPGVDSLLVEVLLQLGHELLEDPVVVRLKPDQLRKPVDEEAWKKHCQDVRIGENRQRGTSCGSVAKHTPFDQEVAGLNPASFIVVSLSYP